MAEREKILIIKPGYSETLDPETTGIVSLGDIVRSTPILHLFPQDRYHVTWMVDDIGYPLLRGNRHIDHVIKINPFTPFQVMRQHFDIVVNLEKDPGICAMADYIPARERYGFGFDTRKGTIFAYPKAERALDLITNYSAKRNSSESWLKILFEMLGAEYRGEAYVLGYRPQNTDVHDVGLNYRVGRKFPFKAWPKSNWENLDERLKGGLDVVWQPASDDIEHIESYMDWIASSRVLVTNDSLGLHLGLAFGKKVIAMFGPTSADEFDDYDNLIKVLPEKTCTCAAERESVCSSPDPCMARIPVETIERHVRDLASR